MELTGVNLFVVLFGVGYICVSIFRLYLSAKLGRQRKEYEAIINEKVEALKKDLQQRSADLNESMNMINNEYKHLMKSMTNITDEAATELKQKLGKYQKMKSDSLSNQPKKGSLKRKKPAKKDSQPPTSPDSNETR